MTIKDIEMRSGMTRANIRYYESLGLLSPARSENGYRDYSQADLDALLKIKLLRSLEVSLEDIGALSRGERELGDQLALQMDVLAAREQELQQARELCRQMRNDSVDYGSLDAAHYLDLMRVRSTAMAEARERDKIESAPVPQRRLLAPGRDSSILSTLINLFLLICGVNIARFDNGMELLVSLVGVAFMIFVEPLLLRTWGTTPGKWLMGLYVRCYDGTKPDYYEGLYRTWNVIRYGEGFYIPFYNLYRLYKSAIACDDGEELPWEEDCLVLIRDEKPWRWIALVGSYALCIAVLVFGMVLSVMPPNRGELSVAEFVENYNDMSDYMTDTIYFLTEDGSFEREPQIGHVVVVGIESRRPVFSFTEENGIMTGFSISHDGRGEQWPSSYATEISTAVQSYIYATAGGMLSKDLDPLIEKLNDEPFKDFSMDIRGYTLTAEYSYSGYMSSDSLSMLWPNDKADEQRYSMRFTLAPQESLTD